MKPDEHGQAFENPAPDLATATGSADPRVQEWLVRSALNADGTCGEEGARTEAQWRDRFGAIIEASRERRFLDELMGAQLAVLYNAGMDRMRASRAGDAPPENVLNDQRLATTMFSLTTRLGKMLGAGGPGRPKKAQPEQTEYPPGPIPVRWLNGYAPGRSWDRPAAPAGKPGDNPQARDDA